MVCNGQVPAWRITCGAGALKLHGLRVNDRRVDEHGERCRSRAGCCRRTCAARRKSRRCSWCGSARAIDEGPPPGTQTLLGEDAVGLSATNIGRLTAVCVEV